MALFGMVQLAGGNLLLVNAMQRIPAAQSGLLGILECRIRPNLGAGVPQRVATGPSHDRRRHHPFSGSGAPAVDVAENKDCG